MQKSPAEKKPRVLVAEDDMLASHLIKEMLTWHGFEIEPARTGQEAVELWEAGVYDIILMDLQMPRLDGISATRIIRQKEQERGGHIPIVAMTANTFDEDRDRCFAAGMDGYISKPLDMKKGLDVIMNLLNK
jgi:CheY-like chemotaxis protein